MLNINKIIIILLLLVISTSSIAKRKFDRKLDGTRNVLYSLYPDLTPAFLDKKIKSLQTPFLYFRSFVSIFFEELRTNSLKESSKTFKKLEAIHAHGLVDYHVDNFNLVYLSKGKFEYTMNDPDEGAVVPLYSEILRYLTGLMLNQNSLTEENITKVMNGYLKGLQGHKIKLSKNILKKIIKLKTFKLEPKEDDLKHFRSLSSPRIAKKLTKKESILFKKKILKVFGNDTKIKDQYKFLNIIGGSGGLMRYRFIIQLTKKSLSKINSNISKTQVIELKEIRKRENPLSIDKKLITTKENYELSTLGKFKPNLFYRVVNIADKKYLIRPRWNKVKIKNPANFKSNEYLQLMVTQANLIGLIHQYSLDRSGVTSSKAYLGLVSKFTNKQWYETASHFSSIIRNQFIQLKEE